MNRGCIYTLSFKTNHYVPESPFCGVTECSGQGDQMLWSVLPATEPLSCVRTLTSVWSALTGHVQSQKLLSRTLLMLTRLWHPAFGHFAAQRPVSIRNLTNVRSALTGCVRSGFSLSGTLLESTRRWPSASGHFTSQRPVTSRRLHLDQMN